MSELEDPSPQFSYHDNQINFKVNHAEKPRFAVSFCQFTIEDYSITPGQDPEGKIAKGQQRIWYGNNQGSFHFTVGRKGSSVPSNFWRNNFKKDESSFDDYPDNLNFAFHGPLDIEVVDEDTDRLRTYTIEKFAMGQGRSGTSNNWWIAAKGAEYKSGNRITCEGVNPSTEEKLYFTFRRGGGNAADVVEITNINYEPVFLAQ